MPALSEAPVADAHTEALFDGVQDGSWYATKFETTPLVRCKTSYGKGPADERVDVNLPPRFRKWRVRAPREFVQESSQWEDPPAANLRFVFYHLIAHIFSDVNQLPRT